MNGWSELDRFLQTDPRDVGCAESMEVLHVYVDLVASGAPVEQRHPCERMSCASTGATAATPRST